MTKLYGLPSLVGRPVGPDDDWIRWRYPGLVHREAQIPTPMRLLGWLCCVVDSGYMCLQELCGLLQMLRNDLLFEQVVHV